MGHACGWLHPALSTRRRGGGGAGGCGWGARGAHCAVGSCGVGGRRRAAHFNGKGLEWVSPHTHSSALGCRPSVMGQGRAGEWRCWVQGPQGQRGQRRRTGRVRLGARGHELGFLAGRLPSCCYVICVCRLVTRRAPSHERSVHGPCCARGESCGDCACVRRCPASRARRRAPGAPAAGAARSCSRARTDRACATDVDSLFLLLHIPPTRARCLESTYALSLATRARLEPPRRHGRGLGAVQPHPDDRPRFRRGPPSMTTPARAFRTVQRRIRVWLGHESARPQAREGRVV